MTALEENIFYIGIYGMLEYYLNHGYIERNGYLVYSMESVIYLK